MSVFLTKAAAEDLADDVYMRGSRSSIAGEQPEADADWDAANRLHALIAGAGEAGVELPEDLVPLAQEFGACG
jgi:NADH dehydrogenase FAD-containing subunit